MASVFKKVLEKTKEDERNLNSDLEKTESAEVSE